ncbi:MAG: hypothetical protein RMM06_05290 [Armatimonadota bacterium]|nr:hypothetical protein [bacterium]MDW8105116.1 hypothetical protein [Armatimonadota bacterium]MDW8290115.1 hypothetical protein [Armatimonadota bacterium]
MKTPGTIWDKLQAIDRRILYLLLLVVIITPIFLPIRLPTVTMPSTQRLYDAIESIPRGGFVMVSCTWSGGTRAENMPQTEAILRHAMQRGLRVAVFSFDVQGAQLSLQIAERVAREVGYQYGKDWVHLGFHPLPSVVMKSMVRDIPGTFDKDYQGKPTKDMPVMQGIKDIQNVDAIVEIAASGIYGDWIGLVVGANKQMKFGFCPTSVMVPETYPYLASGQIVGTMEGMRGAAEYESLIRKRGLASAGMGSISLAHLLIMALIVIGNIGYFVSRARRG